MKNLFSKLMLSAFTFLFTISVYAVAPSITGVTTTNPATYDNGDTISFSVQFDQIVNVAGGSPSLKFRSPDNLSKSASYSSGTGTNTLVFDYLVTSAVNLNDWDGIELEDSSGNPANLVMNGATIQNAGGEDANASVPVTNFAGIKIDSKAPTWSKIEISSTAGNVLGTTRYLPSGSSVTTVSTLTENDTRQSASVGLSVGGGAAQVINYTGSNINGRDDDAQKSGTLTGNGAITLASQSWIDQAGKSITGTPNFIIDDANPLITSYVMDSGAPTFSSIGVVSNNTYDNNYGKSNSVLTFTLTLTNPDSYNGNGDITFTIDGNSQTIPFTNPANSAPAGTYTATFDLATFGTLVDNAAINITGINFADFLGQNITGFTAGTPTPTVIVDTKNPTLNSASASTNGAGGVWAKAGEVTTFTLGFDEEIIRGILNSASTANNLSTLTKEFNISTWGTSDTIQFTVQNGDNGIVNMSNADFTIIDHAGNSATISASNINTLVSEIIKTDTTRPTISGVIITSNNALNNKLAKTNDTIRIDFTTADNLSTNMILTTVNPAVNYILNKAITNYSVSGIGAGQFIERFTDGTENSEISVPFRFAVKDEAGNARGFIQTQLTSPNVQFDRTEPLVQEVKISATSADGTAFLGDVPIYYTKQGDTIDFELQVCDYVDSNNNPPAGTFFGQATTMTDAGLTSVACTTPAGNPSVWRKWTTQLIGIDGTEGLVAFDLLVKDNAGNNDGTANTPNGELDTEIHVTGTTDGSSVIFDKTIPLNPTDVMDTLGAETLPFKHRSNAQFSWTNDADNTINSLIVSGIQDYNVRLVNIDGNHRNERVNSRNFDGRNSNITGAEIPPHDIGNPYKLYLQARDKAGNEAPEEISYTQPYTIGFVGKVVDESGSPVSGALVQVVSRYGEICNLNQELCVGTTNANGEYTVLAEKDQDYNLTFFHPLYYLDKQEESLGHDNDTLVNSVLKGITSPHEIQTSNQGIEITTSEKFVQEDGKLIATKIYAYSFSGEITHSVVDGKIVISSLSRITLVNSNNPAISIQNNGNNTYTIKDAGKVLRTNSVGYIEEGNSDISSFGNSAKYSSGNARIGTKYIPSNGNPKNTFGKYTTPAEWVAFGDRLKNGVAPQILTYINRNGFEVFRGYRKGILGWNRFEKRFQNDVSYRGSYDRKFGDLELVKNSEKEVISFSEKIKVMKQGYQNPETTREDKETQFLQELENLEPLKRVSQKDAYKGILARKAQKKVNKWERKSSFEKKIIKNPYARNLKVIKVRFSNGTSAKIERVMK